MQDMNCLIIEDDESSQLVLENYIEKEEKLNLINTASNAKEAMEIIENNLIHLVFLDINLPGMNGFEIINKISYNPKIIFTTANTDFALKSFDYNVIDYLIKPIYQKDFSRAMYKLFAYENNHNIEFNNKLNSNIHKVIVLKNGSKDFEISTSEIKLIEAYGNYIKIHFCDEVKIIKNTIKELIQILPASRFIQTHKSFIVNTDYITNCNNNEFSINNITVPIGICYKKHIENILSKIQKENF